MNESDKAEDKVTARRLGLAIGAMVAGAAVLLWLSGFATSMLTG